MSEATVNAEIFTDLAALVEDVIALEAIPGSKLLGRTNVTLTPVELHELVAGSANGKMSDAVIAFLHLYQMTQARANAIARGESPATLDQAFFEAYGPGYTW